MPTLGVGWDSLYYGGQDGSSQSDNAELLDEPNSTEPNHDNEPSSRSSTPDLEKASNPPDYEFSPTEYDYSSGSEADIDTDNEMPSIFDNLHRISPASSPRPTPHACSPEGPQYAENEQYINPPQDIPANDQHRPGPQDIPTPPSSEELPDALRAFREWLLKQASTGDLTVKAANLFLKTLDMCLDKGFLRCGEDMNPEHRLPLTLETLQRQTSGGTEWLETYAICPDFGCQTLRKVSLMDPDKAYNCEKCGKLITRPKITRRRARKPLYRHVPILKYTSCPIEQQLREILGRPGILDAVREHWEFLHRADKPPGTLEDIQDGELWRNFKKGDAHFFDDPNNIGLILMCDWFQPNSRRGAPSYSVGAISLCIANLPPHLRGRPENKILVGVTPGPHEPNVDTINHFLKPMVDELLLLWDDGMTFINADGSTRVVRVVIVACACDSPAARKLGGFAGTGGTYPCTACWCSHHELHIFDRTFRRRNRREHKRAARAYKKLPNQNQRKRFMSTIYEKGKPGGYRPSDLLRLPYWDATTMVVVDPMHCVFIGLVDWQFHTIWIDMKHLRPGEELDELQEMVQSTLRPRYCGRPPYGLGTSSAGSLTADPLRSLVAIDLPLAIPVLWDKVDTGSVAQRAHEEWARRQQILEKKKAESRKGDKTTREAAKARNKEDTNNQLVNVPRKRQRKTATAGPSRHSGNGSDESDELPEDARVLANAIQSTEADEHERGFLSRRKQDAESILLLSSAVKLLCGRTVDRVAIENGERFLLRYLEMCTKLRGAKRIHPNHHFVSHLPDQIQRYGPVHQIWTYSGERLNFTLKNTKNNGHGGGEREQTFAVGFHRRRAIIHRLSDIAANEADGLSDWAKYMLHLERSEERGTAASEILGAPDDKTSPRRRSKSVRLEPWKHKELGDALMRARPELRFRRALWEQNDFPILSADVYSLREVTLNGRIFSMSSLSDSIVKAQVFENDEPVERVGEIIDLWEHLYRRSADDIVANRFALIRWYKASAVFAPRSVHLWVENFSDLDIDIHIQDQYLERQAVVPIADIRCHCARMSANLDGNLVWLTIGLERM